MKRIKLYVQIIKLFMFSRRADNLQGIIICRSFFSCFYGWDFNGNFYRRKNPWVSNFIQLFLSFFGWRMFLLCEKSSLNISSARAARIRKENSFEKRDLSSSESICFVEICLIWNLHSLALMFHQFPATRRRREHC